MKKVLETHSSLTFALFISLCCCADPWTGLSFANEFPHPKTCVIQDLNKQLKDEAEAIARVSITYRDVGLYKELSTPDPFSYPSGTVIRHVKVGEMVDILEIYPNDNPSRSYTYKIKTNDGKVGYMMGSYKIIEFYGDRGAIISIYLSKPYEYEGDIKLVDEDIVKYRNFIKQYPQSRYKIEALQNIVGLHLYTFQVRLSVNEKYSRFQEIKEIYKTIFKEVIKPELSLQVDLICDEIMADYEKRILLSRNIDDFNIENFKSSLFSKIINSVITSSMK